LPWLEGRHDGRKILLPVAILRAENVTDLTHLRGTALLDTGATSSAISPRMIDELGLVSHEKRRLVVATEERLVDYYLFRIGLFAEAPDPLPFVFAETAGFGMRPSRDFDVILGMDVICQCDFQLYRSGHWKIGFG
jgi:Aspartyl protease